MSSTVSFTEALAAGPVVLDGGMSNQLAAAGHDLSDELWSARLLAERPDAIAEAHLAYFEAGADVAITASYQATFEGFARRGTGRAETARLLTLSVELARRAAGQARDKGVTRPLWVAASAGPYGAMLADGSEYRGRYGLSVAELERFHRPRLEVLAAARPDVLALETVPDADEAAALLRAVRGLGVPAWLSYTVDGDRTRAGQPLEEAFAPAADADEIVAVGVNCCAPEDVEGAVATAARVTGKPVVAYPNSGETWDARARAWTGRSTLSTDRVLAWERAGARLIGGCCRVGPDVIARIGGTLRPAR
ncbi:homocysteine S-methyltransferase [Streptomyces sp. XM83C]|jgi:homocysteine S-methyltransferase|uniref:homocysteine S-methyltransferase n=1 Tax=unclassified Streptomyces TaxID=2593676 RepID=UPI001FFAA91B|nr:homocysteine S-methyltransferase [Streptomyces sp. XM83C]MCK1823798.1 homocysteine S-methyltransferase [Streptomyces sp. XM83C]